MLYKFHHEGNIYYKNMMQYHRAIILRDTAPKMSASLNLKILAE